MKFSKKVLLKLIKVTKKRDAVADVVDVDVAGPVVPEAMMMNAVADVVPMRMSLALVSAFQWKKRPMRMRRCRGRKRTRGDNIVIPWDLMIEILTRLPAKSLMRFKCVSKLWLSLIRSRYFSNLYLTMPRPPRLYVSLVKHLHCDSLELCHNPGKSAMVSLSPTSATSFDLDLVMSGMGGHQMVVLRGLVLYVVCRKACIYFFGFKIEIE